MAFPFVPKATVEVPDIPYASSVQFPAAESALIVVDMQEWDIWPRHCAKDSWGWQIIDELQPRADDLVCQKNRYDGFYGTSMEHFLSHIWKISYLVLIGTVSNICVLHTAASAGLRWYHIVLPADGISALTEFDQALTLRQVTALYAGRVVKEMTDIAFTRSQN